MRSEPFPSLRTTLTATQAPCELHRRYSPSNCCSGLSWLATNNPNFAIAGPPCGHSTTHSPRPARIHFCFSSLCASQWPAGSFSAHSWSASFSVGNLSFRRVSILLSRQRIKTSRAAITSSSAWVLTRKPHAQRPDSFKLNRRDNPRRTNRHGRRGNPNFRSQRRLWRVLALLNVPVFAAKARRRANTCGKHDSSGTAHCGAGFAVLSFHNRILSRRGAP